MKTALLDKYASLETGVDSIVLSQKECDALDEYNTSLPTGPSIGRTWKCKGYDKVLNTNFWWFAEVVPDPEPMGYGLGSL
jgi:hypothetical protein